MSDMIASSATSSYRDFLEEAFITPIRTAVVVDDEYPTLDVLLAASGSVPAQAGTSAVERANREKLLKIVKLCRGRKPTPWLVDVHNGATPTAEGEGLAASHFDHTDLLILDYHLEANDDSRRSIEILRRLAGNHHFNLVAVYTRAGESSGDIQKTIREIALSLSSPKQFLAPMEPGVERVDDQFETWESLHEGVFERLLDALDEGAFLKVLGRDSTEWSSCEKIPELAPFAELFRGRPAQIKLTTDEAFGYLVEQKQLRLADKMSKDPLGPVDLGIHAGTNWVRTDSLFVTVISKDEAPEKIPQMLLTALEAWAPKPQRLIVSRMRAELSERGGTVESDAMRNPYLQSAWLDDLIVSDQAQRRTNVRQGVARQWENLGGVVWPGVYDFSERLADFLVVDDPSGSKWRSIPRGTPADDTLVHQHFNRYICSKRVEGHHLMTGHILRAGTEYWLCLTPACDLEPGQGGNKGWKALLGDWMPLKVVQLFEEKDHKTALKTATRANHVYVEIDRRLKVLGFGSPDSAPTLRWEQFFAKDCGAIPRDAPLQLGRVAVKDDELKMNIETASVVAQLRYEYALNLLQRLGAQLARVGLDFRKY